MLEDIYGFYYDTALASPSGLPSLLAEIPKSHGVFGTDYPYASEQVCKFTCKGTLDKLNSSVRGCVWRV